MARGGGTEAKRSWEGEEDARKQEQPAPPVLVHKGLTFRNCGLGAADDSARRADGSLTFLFFLGHMGAQPHPSPVFQGPHPVVPTPILQCLNQTVCDVARYPRGSVIPQSMVTAVSSSWAGRGGGQERKLDPRRGLGQHLDLWCGLGKKCEGA